MTKTIITDVLDNNFGRVMITSHSHSIFDINTSIIIDYIKQNGAILLRGFSFNDGELLDFASSFGGEFISHGARHRPTIGNDKTLHTADPGGQKINFHIELGYLPDPPDLLWFHCVEPSKIGGETTLCDGLSVANQLSYKAKNLLCGKKIKYSAFWTRDVWSRYFDSSETSVISEKLKKIDGVNFSFVKDRLLLDFCTPALLDSEIGKQTIFANSILHYMLDGQKDFLSLEDNSQIPSWLIYELSNICEKNSFSLRWEIGDILILNNKRILHGRKGHSDTSRKLHVRMQKFPSINEN